MNRMTHHASGRGHDWSRIKTRKEKKAPPPPPSPVRTLTKGEIAELLRQRPDLRSHVRTRRRDQDALPD